MNFPNDFLWGAATAAYQVEGAAHEDGRVPSVWDSPLSTGHIKHGETGDVACDHYHHMKEDVAQMKKMGLKSYRFSVSWPRVISDERGTVNEKGLAFYIDLVNELHEAGIEPMCTLFHWDMPMWAYERGGWQNDACTQWFAQYAGVVVKALSDKVAYWFTINEPQCFVGVGHIQGVHAPFEKLTGEALQRVCRNVLLAHGRAVSVIRSLAVRKPKIGFAPTCGVILPDSERKEDVEKAYEKFISTDEAVWSDAILRREFSERYFGHLTEEEKETVCQPLDFYAFNHYTSWRYTQPLAEKSRGGPRTAMDWAVEPEGLYWGPKFLYRRYGLPLLVSENGMANCDWVMADGRVHDPQRIDFMTRYLHELRRAAQELPVIGYTYWSLMDNFEWAEGYDKRFGLLYIDYRTQKRIWKDSAYFYAEVIAQNGAQL